MRSILSAGLILACCTMTACAPPSILPPPATVADRTTLDESLALKAEALYRAARTSTEAATDMGLIRGQAATDAADLDRKAYAATLAVRAAYDAGNATSYAEAYREARARVAILLRGSK